MRRREPGLQGVYAAAIRLEYGKSNTVEYDRLPSARQSAQLMNHESANGVELIIIKLCVELFIEIFDPR